jgi:hypothetical protein
MLGHWVKGYRHSEGTRILHSVGNYSPNNAASRLRGPESSAYKMSHVSQLCVNTNGALLNNLCIPCAKCHSMIYIFITVLKL